MPRTPVLSVRLLVPLLLFLLCESIAIAQGDVRLSPPRRRTIIRSDAMVQSAARIGTRTLVAWGTSDWSTDSSTYNLLRMQMLEDTSLLGEQRSVGSADARPFGYVQVIALDDRFLVLWNDRRAGDSVVYARVVGLDGEPVGGEYRFHDRPIAPAGVVLTGREEGYMLLWSDAGTVGPINGRMIDAAGFPTGEVFSYADGSVQRITHLAGVTMIDRGNLPPLLLAGNGDTVALGRAAQKFTFPYHLDPDGSVATIAGDTVRLYTWLLDTIPARVSVVPHAYGAIAGSQFIARDVSGRLQAFHAEGGSGGVSGPADALTASVIKRVEESPGVWSSPMGVTGLLLAAPARSCEHASAEVVSVTHGREQGSFHRLMVGFEGLEVVNCPEEYSARPLVKTLVAVIDGRRAGSDSALRMPSEVPVRRVPNTIASEVHVTIGAAEPKLIAPAGLRVTTFPCMRPGISEQGGELLVAWLAAEEDTTANILQWRPTGQQSDSLHTLVSPRGQPQAGGGVSPIARKIEMLICNGQSILNVTSRWRELPEGAMADSDRQLITMSIPTTEGWKEFVHTTASSDTLALRYSSFTYDLVRCETIGAWGLTDKYGVPIVTKVVAADSTGAWVWGTDSLDLPYTQGFWTIPFGFDDFGYIDYRVFYRFKKGVRVESLGIRNGSYGDFVRLLGPYIIRWKIGDGDLIALLFNLDGSISSKDYITVESSLAGDAMMVQNPRDSSLTFISGSKQGVVMMTVDQQLNLIQPATIVSDSGIAAANPVGIYRNDSLFIAWESAREGTREIFGRVISGTRHAGVREYSRPERGMSMALSPNPAHDRITVKVVSGPEMYSRTTYELLDLLGTIRSSMIAEHSGQSMTFNTRDLPDGVYFIRASMREGACTTRFVVIH